MDEKFLDINDSNLDDLVDIATADSIEQSERIIMCKTIVYGYMLGKLNLLRENANLREKSFIDELIPNNDKFQLQYLKDRLNRD